MSFDPEKITFFAKTDARGQQVPFGIKAKDRQRHMYVVGKTGMGKSTMLENMAAQDIQNGEGVAFIDPHGASAEVLLDYVPEHRVNDVIYFAPFDLANPISFNVMEDVGPDKRHLVVSGLMSTFKKIWVDAWSARMEYILTNALLALIEYPDTTLLSVNRLFSDKLYRNRVVDFIKDPAVKAFWTEEFANYTDRFAAEALPAIQNKIGQFTGNPLIRNIIGQPHSSFDIRKIMDEKKILIMNLSKGLVGETNANLLGSMLTTRIYLAAMSRADLPVNEMRTMPNFYFYVDEFQSFANATFANILSEARKYHLNLIIAHQYIEQMEEEVRDAVFGNVGTTIAFRVGPFDAEVLETVFTPRFLATDLVNLGFAQIYLTLMIDGIGSQPFSAVTLPPVAHPHVSCKDMVIAASRRNYTKTRDVVEQLVADLHAPVIAEKKPERIDKPERKEVSKESRDGEESVKRPVSNQNSGMQKPPVRPQEQRRDTPRLDTRTEKPVRNERIDRGDRTDRTESPRRNEERRDKLPTPSGDKSLADLRAVLASLTATEKAAPAGESASKPKDVPNPGVKSGSGQHRAALAQTLSRVAQPAPLAEPANPRAEVVPQEMTVLTPPAQPVRRAEDAAPEPSQRVESAVTPKEELERLMAETEAAFSALNAQGANSTSDDPLAPKKIERMFKQSGNERSPFST
jgi:Type IV secretion-system coupling protein DNA-binding domain